MQSRGLEIVVGFFVCLGIAAVFILTMRVSNLANTSSVQGGYTVTADFTNIGGLKTGAQVDLAGVRIGRVTRINVDQTTYDAVVTMTIDKQYKIPKDSNASILTAGLLGEQYIGIEPGASGNYLGDGDEIKLTQSAVILENVINHLFYTLTQQGGGNGGGSGGP